jgi:hypothetical protein
MTGGTQSQNIRAFITNQGIVLSGNSYFRFNDGSIQTVAAAPFVYTQAAFNTANSATSNTIVSQGINLTQNTAIQSAYNQSNTAQLLGQAAYNQANVTIGVDATQNASITVIQGVDATQNLAITSVYNQHNTTSLIAQSSFNKANNALANTSGTFAGSLNVTSFLSATGNVSGNYFIGDGSQLTGISTSFDLEMHVSKNGNDSTGTGTILRPYLTITHALTQVTGGRNTIVVHPGGYTENPTITNLATQLITYDTTGASTLVYGTVTIANTTGRIAGLKMTNLAITGNAQAYINSSTVDEQFTKSSSGYVEVDDCELQVTGNVLISGSGVMSIVGNKLNNLVVNNAGASVLVKGADDCVMPRVTAGSLNIVDSTIRASSNTANAVTASVGTVVTLMNNQIVTPASDTVARVSIAGYHSIISVVYDKANSTLSNSLNSVGYFQTVNVDSLVSSGKVTMNGTVVLANTNFSATEAALTISASPSVTAPADDGYMIHISGKNGIPSRIVSDSYGTGAYSVYASRTARGNVSNPSPVQAGDIIGRFSANGYGNTKFQQFGTGRIDFVAAENYTDTTTASQIQFWNCAAGTNTLTQIATFNGTSVVFAGVVNPQKGLLLSPNVLSGITTTLNIDIANNSLYYFKTNATTTINLSGFATGKIVEVWLTNTDTGGGSNHTITHGCLANNSTTGAASFTLSSLHSAYLKYFSIDGDLANTYVSVNYS